MILNQSIHGRQNIIAMRELKFIILMICLTFQYICCITITSQITAPNTQRMVRETLPKKSLQKKNIRNL